jgi:hypothetical protein
LHLLKTVTKRPLLPKPSTKRPLSRNRVSVRFPFEVVATHTSAAPPLWAGLPRAAPPPPELTQSTAASAPHTIRIPPHICTSAPATHPYPIASSSSLRQVDERTTSCDACPPRDDALRSRLLGAPLGQQDLVPLVERVGDHGRSRRRTRSAAAELGLVQRGL